MSISTVRIRRSEGSSLARSSDLHRLPRAAPAPSVGLHDSLVRTAGGEKDLSEFGSARTRVVWAGESHPGPNPEPDLQVSKHPALQTALITLRKFSAYGTPGKESGGSISSSPAHSWRSRVRVGYGRLVRSLALRVFRIAGNDGRHGITRMP